MGVHPNPLNPNSPAYRVVSPPKEGTITTAVVAAATRLTNFDHPTGPKCMFRLGEMSICGHLITQLAHAGMRRIIVICGYQGETFQALLEKECIFPATWGVALEFVQLGGAFQDGMCRSLLSVKKHIGSQRFVLAMADHIFDPDLIYSVADYRVAKDEMVVAVEKDFSGLVGISTNKVNGVKLTGETVTAIEQSMEAPDAIDAGLFQLDPSVFDEIEKALDGAAYIRTVDFLTRFVGSRRLIGLSTNKNMWFSVESKEALLEAANAEVLSALCLNCSKKWGVARMPGGSEVKKPELEGADKEDNSDWKSFPVEKWKDTVYTNARYFNELIVDQKEWVTNVAKHLKLSGRRVTLIEVGSGTGEFIWPVVNDFRSCIGLDFNQNFIKYCSDLTPVQHRHKVHFVHGDATKLMQEMREKAPDTIWDDARVVACVGNTFGIFPDAIKPLVYQQMAELAGPDGFVLIGYWNAAWFGDAVQNFYFANPSLCGKFNGESVDYANTRLVTPSGYCTHWTGVDEARQVLIQNGLEEVTIEEKGKGVLVTARQGSCGVGLTAEEDKRAQAYYDSDDAFNFYSYVWGGECIHVGLYEPTPKPDTRVVLAAAIKSMERLFELRAPPKDSRIMDMGSAYGGTARFAAKAYNAKVSCVDLSAKENKVNAERTRAAGLSNQVWINGERSFTQTGEDSASFDLVTSQDSFLHAGQYRSAAIAEAARVLKPGGYLVFTDIMESETCDLNQMGPVFKRIHLDDMGSVSKYKKWAAEAGLVFEEFEDHTEQLARHYGTVCAILTNLHNSGILTGKVSQEFLDKMVNGLKSWVEQAGNKNLAWGYLVFRKQ